MGNGIGTPEATSVITATHLALIVVLIVLVAFAIWWGGRRRHAQRRAEEEARERREDAPVAAPAPAARVAPPVAPPPPPLARDESIPASAPRDANPASPAAVTPAPDAPVVAPPVSPPAPAPASASADLADQPVTLIKGLGPKVAARLAEQGITTVGDLAALSEAEAAALDARLGNFAGRMARDRWLDQARLLAAGDRAGFEATFGKLG